MRFLKEKLVLRTYQEAVLGKIYDKNSFLVLPTGAGKTIVAIALAGLKIKTGKILILAPTKPLVVQHKSSFTDYFDKSEEIVVLTGAVKPSSRKELWTSSKIVCATPQTVEADLIKRYFNPEDFSLEIFDEAHRAVGDYAYTWLAKKFCTSSQILAMSASPASTKERLDKIRDNLYIKHFEFKDGSSMKDFVKDKTQEKIFVELNATQKEISKLLKSILKDSVQILYSSGLVKSSDETKIRKAQLLIMQKQLFAQENKEIETYFLISTITACIKLLHLIEMLETQSVKSFNEAMIKIKTQASKVKASKKIVEDWRYSRIKLLSEKMDGEHHEKMKKVLDLIDGSSKVIIFSQYRNTVDELVELINLKSGAKAKAFVGQKGGLSQKKQIEVLEEYKSGEFNVLVATSVSEEGIHIENADIGIFYEPVPSALRTIQRRGRIGRINIGKIYLLITKNTIDEKYYWVSYHKEKRMKDLLQNENNY